MWMLTVLSLRLLCCHGDSIRWNEDLEEAKQQMCSYHSKVWMTVYNDTDNRTNDYDLGINCKAVSDEMRFTGVAL